MPEHRWVIIPGLIQRSPVRTKKLLKYADLISNGYIKAGEMPDEDGKYLVKLALKEEKLKKLSNKQDVQILDSTPCETLNMINNKQYGAEEWEEIYCL